eukprot:3739858-Rhodomonas_salina.2
MPGTEPGHAGTRFLLLRRCYERHPSGVEPRISLRASYAMSGTDIAYGAVSAYALAMRCPSGPSASGAVRHDVGVSCPIPLRRRNHPTPTPPLSPYAYAAAITRRHATACCNHPTRTLSPYEADITLRDSYHHTPPIRDAVVWACGVPVLTVGTLGYQSVRGPYTRRY